MDLALPKCQVLNSLSDVQTVLSSLSAENKALKTCWTYTALLWCLLLLLFFITTLINNLPLEHVVCSWSIFPYSQWNHRLWCHCSPRVSHCGVTSRRVSLGQERSSVRFSTVLGLTLLWWGCIEKLPKHLCSMSLAACKLVGKRS